MISRNILALTLALGTSTAALAEVGVELKGPEGRAGIDVDVDVGAKATTPSKAWVGRDVYSSDGEDLGEVAAISDDQIYVDMGGFLGLGETRVLLDDDQIESVKDDRIILKLTEEEAQNLPAAGDIKPAAE